MNAKTVYTQALSTFRLQTVDSYGSTTNRYAYDELKRLAKGNGFAFFMAIETVFGGMSVRFQEQVYNTYRSTL
jgi:hypothetical protein